MIGVKNLTKIYRTSVKSGNFFQDLFFRKYKENKALDNVSFEIQSNELVGFIGPNGAGKTTTMKILSGILYPTAGQVKVMDYVPFEKNYSFLKQIAFVMGQKNQLIWELPATESFELNKEIYEIEDSDYKKTVSELVEMLDCGKFIDQAVKTLSLGQRMRLELINSLIHKPKVLFLDEPTIGLDIFAQATITKFIKEYQKRNKSIVILTSHYMEDVKRLAKRVIMINYGKIVFDGQLSFLIQKYSQEKTINIVLMTPLSKEFIVPENLSCEYNYPTLRIKVRKEDIASVLATILKQIEFSDVTIEDEPIEEVIKKFFYKS